MGEYEVESVIKSVETLLRKAKAIQDSKTQIFDEMDIGIDNAIKSGGIKKDDIIKIGDNDIERVIKSLNESKTDHAKFNRNLKIAFDIIAGIKDILI